MIIDCHAHVFQNWAGPCGHASRDEHWRYMQKALTHTNARTRRARDGAPAATAALSRPGDHSWTGLRDDVNFRTGPYGRLEFTADGEDYYIQYMPVGMADIEAPPEQMLAQMSYVGVDHCVLQAATIYGIMNDYHAFCQRQYPHAFTGLFQVNEALADTPRWMAELTRARRELALGGLYYQLDTFSRYGCQWSFDDPRYNEFWECVASMGIPVFLDATPVPNYDAASYVANMGRLDTLLTRYPAMRWSVIMAPPVKYFAKDGKWEFPEPVARAYGRENLQLEVCYPITMGGAWDYPYREAQPLIKDLRDRYGAQKLLWGSDMPNVERFCTYKQCLDYVLKYCDFLSAKEKDMVLGENAADLCGIKTDA
jgi:predicted TIM-barrel fold metal-dependent hydrolase